MTFIWPIMLLSLLLIPLLLGVYLRLLRRRRQAAAELGPLRLVSSSAGRDVGRRRHVPPALFLGGLTFLLVGLARPEMEVSLPRVEGTVILAFDVSSSMLAEDLEPTRLAAAQAAARAFVAEQPETVQIGVVAFSNGGLVVQPPTDDETAVLATIDRLSPQGGTSLGQGIFTSLNAIAGEPLTLDVAALDANILEDDAPPDDALATAVGYYPSAVIVLLSDGENTESPDPLAVAQVAATAGVRIYPIGIGRAEGTVLELDGFNIVTQLDETSLQDIASLTNGAYYHAEDAESLQEIYQTIDLQLTVAGDKMEVTALLAGLGLLFFLLGGALSPAWFGRAP